MAIWIQSLSWTLICSLGQGIAVYATLRLILKLMPAAAHAKYHLSLSALTVMLAWFAGTWWQQYHLFSVAEQQAVITSQPIHIMSLAGFDTGNHSLLAMMRAIFPWLAILYVTGLLVMLVRLSYGMLQLFSLRTNGLSQAPAALNSLLASLQHRLSISGTVRLFISARAQVPMVIGFLKPMILMPAAALAQLSTAQLETILLHELAHIKRYDYLVNILQTVAETILFFNPFAWMISAIIRREREHACDDLVLVHTREPLYYAMALAALARYPGAASALAIKATGKSHHLFHRIKRIMEMKKNPLSYSRMAAAILIITAITASVVWITPSFALPGKDKVVKNTAAVQKAPQVQTAVNDHGENQLIHELLKDRMVDEIKGFLVERNESKLYINGQQQSAEIAAKYLQSIKPAFIRVQVFPFMERLKMHPDADLLQIIAPVSFSSPCVQTTPKEGC